MSIMLLVLIVIGFALVTLSTFFWLGVPGTIFAVLAGHSKKTAKLSMFSLSSVHPILESRTVHEFIQTLPDQAKAAAYDDIMGTLRKLLLDIKKHRGNYPEDINALKQFVMSQLRYNIERSPARSALETAKFRDLAELFCMTEVMQDIYVADCKASRTRLPKGIL